jgi:hypothetical protein
MTQLESLRAIANAVLYEGYMLYPYRPSALKNQRPGWSFGSLLPPAYVIANPGESAFMSAQVLASIRDTAALEIEARFLQLQDSAAEGTTERSVQTQIAVGELLRDSQTIPFRFGNRQSSIEGVLEIRAELIAEKLLLSPIILYDYPQIAPESPGDFFDSSEIDELLTLRVLTLSDAEKQEIQRTNPRAREVLQRTESTTPEEVLKMHGVFRDLHRVKGE